MFDYFYGGQAGLFSFYRIPKALFTDARIRGISAEAKILYGLLLDRMGLSVKNGWTDDTGRVYIIFTTEEIMEALYCADNKATKLMKELESCGLIERKRRGLGKPSLIYVKNFISESSEPRIQNRENHDSGTVKNATLESLKSRGIKNNQNHTDLSETDPFPSGEGDGVAVGTESEGNNIRARYQEYFLRQFAFDQATAFQLLHKLGGFIIRTAERFHDFFRCKDDIHLACIIHPAILHRKPHPIQQETIQDFCFCRDTAKSGVYKESFG